MSGMVGGVSLRPAKGMPTNVTPPLVSRGGL